MSKVKKVVELADETFIAPEFQVRARKVYPVTRYGTHIHPQTGEQYLVSKVIGEFDCPLIATEVASAMARAENGKVVTKGDVTYSPSRSADER